MNSTKAKEILSQGILSFLVIAFNETKQVEFKITKDELQPVDWLVQVTDNCIQRRVQQNIIILSLEINQMNSTHVTAYPVFSLLLIYAYELQTNVGLH